MNTQYKRCIWGWLLRVLFQRYHHFPCDYSFVSFLILLTLESHLSENLMYLAVRMDTSPCSWFAVAFTWSFYVFSSQIFHVLSTLSNNEVRAPKKDAEIFPPKKRGREAVQKPILQDHPRTCNVANNQSCLSSFRKDWVVGPLPNGLSMAFEWGWS